MAMNQNIPKPWCSGENWNSYKYVIHCGWQIAVHPSNPPAPKVPRRGSLAASDTDSSTAQAPQQLGLQLGLWGQPRPKLGPTQANFVDSMRHAESLHVYRYFHRFPPLFGFDGGSCKNMLHIGPVLGPTCVQTYPSCAMLELSWAQVGATEFGTSYAQVGPKWAPVRPNLRPRTAQVWPQSAFGCAK